MTKGAGNSTDGEPYEAHFADKYGNVCVQLVRQPAILANYFKYSNRVDMHNQAQKFDLALEKKWITHEAYYRLYTTMVGITITDTWKILKKKDASHSSITKFADILAHEMLYHARSLQYDIQETVVTIQPDKSSVTASIITADIFNRNLTHTKCFLKDKKKVRCI